MSGANEVIYAYFIEEITFAQAILLMM